MNIIQITSNYQHDDKDKGYERTYCFYDESGCFRWSCDVYGACIKAPTIYRSANSQDKDFKMEAKGKFLNATYFLEDEQGIRFATITRKGIGFRWKILGNTNQEVARIIDPSSKKEAFIRGLLSALPDGYAVVAGNNLVAAIQKEKLSKKIEQKPRNILGKFLERIFEPRGLTLRLEPRYSSGFDMRILMAGMTLLDVHDIKGVNRN